MEINTFQELRLLVTSGFTDWKSLGDVRSVEQDDLILFNYTNAAQFANRWNWFERQSRGLILNRETGEVVARPFPKFFNWGETNQPTASLVELTEKIDGSLGILYRHNGEFKIATRGSFTSDQALWPARRSKTTISRRCHRPTLCCSRSSIPKIGS